ncbi:hypothetical protein, partial [Novosphingobium album (ex Liu et al. 2023)]
RIDLPDHTIRLCDGGRIVWGAEVYRARDPIYGTLGSIEPLSEGAGDELPPLDMTLLPPSSASAADLVQPAMQGSPMRLWLAEYDVETGAVLGTPELRFDGELDQATLSLMLELGLTVIAAAARLFELNIGNSLSPSWHKSIWPGETGHDNATGLGRPVAWGVDAPIGTTVSTGGYGPASGYDRV